MANTVFTRTWRPRWSTCRRNEALPVPMLQLADALGWASFGIVSHDVGSCVGQAIAAPLASSAGTGGNASPLHSTAQPTPARRHRDRSPPCGACAVAGVRRGGAPNSRCRPAGESRSTRGRHRCGRHHGASLGMVMMVVNTTRRRPLPMRELSVQAMQAHSRGPPKAAGTFLEWPRRPDNATIFLLCIRNSGAARHAYS